MSLVLACKELNGIIYLSQLGPTVDDQTPGAFSGWQPVGPGLRPSIQEYNGEFFILTFEYLSHLFTRVVQVSTLPDTTHWPPSIVNPVEQSGGPNPPNPITYTFELAADSLSLRTTATQNSFAHLQEYFNPPVIQQPLVYINPATIPPTYSATLQLAPPWVSSTSYSPGQEVLYNGISWVCLSPNTNNAPNPTSGFWGIVFAPQAPASQTVYYRLYRRTFTPTVGPWEMIMDWSPTLDFTDTNLGSLRFQYSATWGSFYSFTQQWNPNAFTEGIVGEKFITVDSTHPPLGVQTSGNDSLTLDETSSTSYGSFGTRQLFLVESANDEIQLSETLLGESSNSYGTFGTRGLFIFLPPVSDTIQIAEMGGVTAGVNNFVASGFALRAYMGI